MRNPTRPAFGLAPAREIPITAGLTCAILLVSLVGAVTQRRFGLGAGLLRFQRDAVVDLELWRLFTYPLVETDFLALLLGLVILWIFGGWFERVYGRRDFVKFFVISSVGAALISIPLSYLVNLVMPFSDLGVAEGPDAALDAMLVAFALASPNANVLFGFVLPMRAKTIIFVILGLDVVRGILSGASALSITLGGMLMGYLLVTGNWRPSRWWTRFRLQQVRRRSGLYVVPPRDKTLH